MSQSIEDENAKKKKSIQLNIEFQGVSKSHMLHIWQQLKQNQIPEAEDYILARSMADHPHWYAIFETIGIFEDSYHEYPGNINPYEHVQFHYLLGVQILQKKPQQAFLFYQARMKKKEDPHEVIHMMIHIFQSHLAQLAQYIAHDEALQQTLAHHQADMNDDEVDAPIQIQVDHQHYTQLLKSFQKLSRAEIWKKLGFAEIPPLHPEQELLF